MTEKEWKFICNAISIMILIMIITIVVSFSLGRNYKPTLDVKNEQWFQEKACYIYNLATDIIDGQDKYKELNSCIKEYNLEAQKVRYWNYSCPPEFTINYLLH